MRQRSALGLAIFLFALAAPAYGQVKLEWKFKEGDRFYQEVASKSRQSGKMKIAGQDQNSTDTMSQSGVSSFRVLKKNPDGSVLLEHKFETMEVKATNATASPAAILQQLQGASLRLTLNPKNQVTRLEGLPEIVKKIAGEDPQLRKTAEGVINEEMMRRQFEDSFAFLPDKPVQVGDKWQRRSAVPLGPMGSFSTVHSFTYAGKDSLDSRPVEKITVTATMTYSPPKPGESAGFFIITKGDLKGEGITGTYYFDAAAGRLVQSDMRMKIKGTYTIAAAGQNAEVAMDQDTTSRIRILDRAPAK